MALVTNCDKVHNLVTQVNIYGCIKMEEKLEIGDYHKISFITGYSYSMVEKVAKGNAENKLIQAAIVQLLAKRKQMLSELRGMFLPKNPNYSRISTLS